MNSLTTRFSGCLFLFWMITGVTYSQSSTEELAKKLANPVANLISVPFQTNTDFGIGTFNGSRMTVNVQPVIPFALTPKLNLITRWIVPIMAQNDITGNSTRQSGISDAVITGFISPTTSKVTWGVGPVVVVPTASSSSLGAKKWGFGPSAVILTQKNGWTYGGLINHVVSLTASESSRSFSATLINPFLTYNWKSGAGLTAAFEYNRDWKNDSSSLVLIPTASAVTKFGNQTISMAIGPRIHLSPENRPDLGIRAGISLIFPK